MSLFEAKNVHKRFGQQVVLENINLVFEEKIQIFLQFIIRLF